MERLLISFVAATILSLSGSVYAQSQAQPPAAAPGSAQVSDGDLETFATIYVKLQDTASKYESELLRVETEEQARDVQARMQKESLDTVAQHGWTADRYVAVAEAINANPQLAEKTRRLIETRP